MGVYIKGMEMPKSCLNCFLSRSGCRAVLKRMRAEAGTWIPANYRHDDCPLVPVPPHGDLIERKAAHDSLLDGMVMTGYQSRALDCISDFYVPTIISAEEGE